MQIISMARSGQLKQKIDDEQIKAMLNESAGGQKKVREGVREGGRGHQRANAPIHQRTDVPTHRLPSYSPTRPAHSRPHHLTTSLANSLTTLPTTFIHDLTHDPTHGPTHHYTHPVTRDSGDDEEADLL